MRPRASLTDNLARKSARVGRVGGHVGEDVRVGVGAMEFKLNRMLIIKSSRFDRI